LKNLKEKILHSLQKSPQSLPIRTLLKRMKIMDKSKKAFFAALDELKAEGKVTVSKKKRVHLPHKDDTVEAAIVSLSRGFAFARPDDGGEDIFILGGKLNHAFVGDRVLLSHIQQSAKGPSADVEKVVEKSSRTTTGTFRSEGEVHTLIPDISVRYEIPVTRKSAALAKDGDKVQARIRTKLHSHELEAEIVKIYGRAGSAKICADAILDEYGIRTDFSKEALAEAEEAASREITPADLKGRLDLRKLSICTIDGADAKDLDDAISVSKKRDGGYRLGVHIADVSHYIPPDGALDLEARSRGTSVYFADRVVPMLPKSLSNGVCSLNAGEDKLTFSALIELDRSGNIESYRFRKSVIRSKVRGVYSEVNSLFDGTADRALRRKYTPVIRSLHAARELAAVLQRRFVQNGVIDLESTESVFTLNEDGICVDVRPRRSGEAEQMIESLMITANRAAAMLAKSAGIPFVYRVHEQPNPERVKTLVQLVDAAGLDSKPLKHKNGKIAPADFADIMEQAKGTPAQKVISHQLLRTMAKARYDVNPLGHFGLALEDYCHFTSPIRRYPDTAIHRILSAMLKTKDSEKLRQRFTDFAAEAAKLSSDAEIRAMSAERDAEDCYTAEYMAQHIGEVYDGVVSGVTQHGVFVELDSSAEGFVPMDSFPDSHYRFDGVITQVDAKTGSRLTIGHPLRIRVASADVASGRIDFAYAGAEK
jgi:ribonuclease R